METITAAQVNASDTLIFGGTEYRVRSAIHSSHCSELTFWDTNDHQPYHYEPGHPMIRKTT